MATVPEKTKADAVLKAFPLTTDIANAKVFPASGTAAGITGISLDVTCGTTAA